MPVFPSRPHSPRRNALVRLIRQRPLLCFGVPFLATMVGASFGLAALTQTRYDYNATKVQTISKEEALRMSKDRKRIDIREEYFRLQARGDENDDWEPKRIERPEGTPQWGVPPVSAEELDPANAEREERIPPPASGKKAVVLGPDGKPCKACNSKLAFGQAIKGAAAAKKKECPPDIEELGRATWTFLHSAAAYYPGQPDIKQQRHMRALLDALPHLYPCHTCAQALGEEYQREQREGGWEQRDLTLSSAVSTGPGLRKWLCGIHNEVNHRLGKPTFPCAEPRLAQRWKDGCD